MNEQEKERHYSTMTEAELAEWDAEIEAEAQKAKAATQRHSKRKRARRYIGCPWEFLVDICRRARGSTALIVALCVYRQTTIHRRQTVTLNAAELAELGVDRKLAPRRSTAWRPPESYNYIERNWAEN